MSERPARKGKGWVVPAAVAGVAIVLIAILTLPFGTAGDGPSATNESAKAAAASGEEPAANVDVVEDTPDLSFIERREPTDPLKAGDVKAPVGLVIFSDYQCPYCAAWSKDTLPRMMEYVENGDLYIEWRDLNIFGEESERASHAAYAAGLQGKFWEYHAGLFPDGKIRSAGELSDEALKALAEDIGLDPTQFAEDMASPETTQQVRINQKLGIDLGVYSTPAFVVGGKAVVGAQPTEVFIDAVDEALARAQG